ncbi:MAG: hypothetical protein HYX65_11130 [Gemmatimonadetes bacterium]|nr:hypothetical protein [Gemmatimonadota bacterium]
MTTSRDDTAAAPRAQPVLHTLSLDPASLAAATGPALDRADAAAGGLQVLILVPDPALGVATAERLADAPVRVVAATSARRGARLLAEGAPAALAISLDDALALLRASQLKLEPLRALVIGGADELLASRAEALEAFLADVPREALRIATAARVGEGFKAFAERHLRRVRLEAGPAGAPLESPLHVLTVAHGAHASALRSLLDALDPPSAAVVVESDAAATAVEGALRPLGLGGAGSSVTVVRGDAIPSHAALVVLFDVPGSRDVLHAVAAATPVRAVVLAEPRELGRLAALSGGALLPLDIAAAASAAMRRHDLALREEIAAVLATGLPLRELVVIEPLLAAHDAATIAAATLRLLESARARAPRAAAVESPVTPAAPAAAPAFVRRDHDRDDQPRGPRRDVTPRDRGDRPPRRDRGDRGDRPARSNAPREGARGDRSVRGDRPDRGPRPGPPRDRIGAPLRDRDRGEGTRGPARGPRGPAEGGDRREWSDRGEALRRSRKPRREDS